MQLLGVLIFIGILTLLLLAGVYLARTQKTHNKPASALDDLYRAKGFGNVVDANEQFRQNISMGNHQHAARRKQQTHHQQQRREEE